MITRMLLGVALVALVSSSNVAGQKPDDVVLIFFGLATVSDIYKSFLVIIIGGFMPITAYSFLWVRRVKKETEFARVVALLGIARGEAEFAHDRITAAQQVLS